MVVPEQSLTVAELAKQNYLRPEQRQDLERSASEIGNILSDPHLRAVADEEALQTQLNRERELLESGTPPEYDTATKNKLFRLGQKLESDIQSTMLTPSEMERPTPGNIDKYMRWHYGSFNGDQKMAALRTIKQILDPCNNEPNFLSIAGLREGIDESHRVNLPVYRDNYDKIQWEEVVEDNLIRDMDPQEYQTFLELKLLDWSKAGICKELNWSTRQYEAALLKLRDAHGIKPVVDPLTSDEKTNLLGKDVIKEEEAAAKYTFMPKEWPKTHIQELGLSIMGFSKEADVPNPRFYQYAREGRWPTAVYNAVAQTLSRLQEEKAQQRRSEPVRGFRLTEPDMSDDAELTEV